MTDFNYDTTLFFLVTNNMEPGRGDSQVLCMSMWVGVGVGGCGVWVWVGMVGTKGIGHQLIIPGILPAEALPIFFLCCGSPNHIKSKNPINQLAII